MKETPPITNAEKQPRYRLQKKVQLASRTRVRRGRIFQDQCNLRGNDYQRQMNPTRSNVTIEFDLIIISIINT